MMRIERDIRHEPIAIIGDREARKSIKTSYATVASSDHCRVHAVPAYRRRSVDDVGSGGRAVERRTVNRGDGGPIPPAAVSKLRQFRSPHIACVFRRHQKHQKPNVYARGNKRSHIGGKCVTFSGLTHSRGQL